MQQPPTRMPDFEARRLQTQAVQNNGGGGAKNINVIIPLNRFSFFEELEDKMLVPMQLQFEITLNDDGELIHMANGTDPGRVVVNRFLLWVPRLTPKDSLYDKFVSSFLKETQWKIFDYAVNKCPPPFPLKP